MDDYRSRSVTAALTPQPQVARGAVQVHTAVWPADGSGVPTTYPGRLAVTSPDSRYLVTSSDQ